MVHQGDVIRIEGQSFPALVLSKDFLTGKALRFSVRLLSRQLKLRCIFGSKEMISLE